MHSQLPRVVITIHLHSGVHCSDVCSVEVGLEQGQAEFA